MKVFLNGEEREIEINPMVYKMMEKYAEEVQKALQTQATEQLDKMILSLFRGEDYVPRD